MEIKLKSPVLKDPISAAIGTSSALAKAKAAVTYRRTFDKFLLDSADVGGKKYVHIIVHHCSNLKFTH